MRILGIDPGLNGGAAVLGVERGCADVLSVMEIPTTGIDAKRRVDVQKLNLWITALAPDIAFIERAGVMPRQGNASGFVYGRAVGAIEATVTLRGIPLHVIEPQTWKRHFKLSGGDKEGSRQAVLALIPRARGVLPLKKHHNIAEAILIALYGADHIREFPYAGNGRATGDGAADRARATGIPYPEW